MNKVAVFFKSIGRNWFIILIIAIVLVFFLNQQIAIWMTVIAIIIFLLLYIPPHFSTNKFVNFLKEYFMIEDDTVAEKLAKPLREVRQSMFDLMKGQKNKKWLIVFLNKRYIFFHQDTIEKFTELYHKGYDEKKMLEKLREYDLREKSHVKIIKETLLKSERLGEREISVQERIDNKKFK